MISNRFSLQGKKGLIAGIANANSIAYGCAKACCEAGAALLLTSTVIPRPSPLSGRSQQNSAVQL
jgi:enoyl-[acyl-carrier-protein] reductase (NADH)